MERNERGSVSGALMKSLFYYVSMDTQSEIVLLPAIQLLSVPEPAGSALIGVRRLARLVG
jgi:hypothetical protein